jgi:hypothetical protein
MSHEREDYVWFGISGLEGNERFEGLDKFWAHVLQRDCC